MTAAGDATIRTALVSDVAGCARLFAAGQQEIEPRSPPWSEAGFANEVVGADIRVAAAGGRVVGFLSLWRPDGFVHFLHVAPAWRGRGLGRRLLARARSEAGRPLELKCLATNRAALAFYRRLGWRTVGGADGIATPFLRLREGS